MKIKDGFVKQTVAGQCVAVATGKAAESFHGMVKMNQTASFIWDCLVKGADEDELVQALTMEFEVDANRARTDVLSVVGALRDAGILE